MGIVEGFGLFAAGAASFASITAVVVRVVEFRERKTPSKHDVRQVDEH